MQTQTSICLLDPSLLTQTSSMSLAISMSHVIFLPFCICYMGITYLRMKSVWRVDMFSSETSCLFIHSTNICWVPILFQAPCPGNLRQSILLLSQSLHFSGGESQDARTHIDEQESSRHSLCPVPPFSIILIHASSTASSCKNLQLSTWDFLWLAWSSCRTGLKCWGHNSSIIVPNQ